MAKRPVFVVCEDEKLFKTVYVEFSFNPGFSRVQKQKNIMALHASYRRAYGGDPLEISTKSLQPEGAALSAFSLTKRVKSLGRSIPVECVYQGAKVFEHGGPYKDLYLKTGRDAKRDSRLISSGKVISFDFEGNRFETVPNFCFYDWIYIRALVENPQLSDKILSCSAFTDIEFNPNKSKNCQARAVAVFVSLHRRNMLAQTESYDDFRALFFEGEKV